MTTRFCKYLPNGKIQFIGEVPANMLELQGDNVLEIGQDVEPSSHYIDMVSMTAVPMMESPNKYCQFDYESKVWVDPRTLLQLQDLKWVEMKLARDAVEFGVFTYNGMVFDGDVNAQRRLVTCISISKSLLAAGQSVSTEFTLADNSVVMLTSEDFVGIEMAKAAAVTQAFAKGVELRTTIYSTTTVEGLAAIVW